MKSRRNAPEQKKAELRPTEVKMVPEVTEVETPAGFPMDLGADMLLTKNNKKKCNVLFTTFDPLLLLTTMNWFNLLSFGLAVILTERVEIKPYKSFCFFEELEQGQTYGVQFQSEEGEFHVNIAGPTGILYDTSKDVYGSFTFPAKQAGRYEVCFENTQAQPRRINFNELGQVKSESKEKLDQAQIELRDLNAGLRSLRDEQEYLLQRELTHKDIAHGTNRRVMWWFIFQIGLLASVGYFQIYFLKRFFEVRRVV